MIRNIPKSVLTEGLDLPYTALYTEYVGKSRWSIRYRIVFTYEGSFWQTTFQEAATEMQDEGPWEYLDEVECVQVHQVEKLVKVWEPV